MRSHGSFLLFIHRHQEYYYSITSLKVPSRAHGCEPLSLLQYHRDQLVVLQGGFWQKTINQVHGS